MQVPVVSSKYTFHPLPGRRVERAGAAALGGMCRGTAGPDSISLKKTVLAF